MKALIVVDVQRDFCEGGSLAVPGGNAVAEGIAADYCVKATAVDALAEGFTVTILSDLTVGIYLSGAEVAAELEAA